MQVGTLVKHLPERVSSRRAKWLGIVVAVNDQYALVEWLNEGYNSYHPPQHLEVLCE